IKLLQAAADPSNKKMTGSVLFLRKKWDLAYTSVRRPPRAPDQKKPPHPSQTVPPSSSIERLFGLFAQIEAAPRASEAAPVKSEMKVADGNGQDSRDPRVNRTIRFMLAGQNTGPESGVVVGVNGKELIVRLTGGLIIRVNEEFGDKIIGLSGNALQSP